MRRTSRAGVTRRRVLESASGVVAAALVAPGARISGASLTAGPDAAQAAAPVATGGADVTGRLARYMVAARERALPAQVARDAKQRILDTLGAIISGAVL